MIKGLIENPEKEFCKKYDRSFVVLFRRDGCIGHRIAGTEFVSYFDVRNNTYEEWEEFDENL